MLGAAANGRAVEVLLFGRLLAALKWGFNAAQEVVNNPWEPEEVIFILAWVVGVRPLLHLLWSVRKALGSLAQRRASEAAAAGAVFESSGFARLAVPLRQLGWCFAALWAFDQAMLLAATLGQPVNHALPLIAGFPDAAYTVWAGYAALYCQNEWFARRAAKPAAESALMAQRALTLTTVLLTLVASTSMLGLHPATLLGIGGMAGFASSLAIKDVLTNLFAGITLALQRPFSEGDEIVFGGVTATGAQQPAVCMRMCRARADDAPLLQW